VYKFEKEFERFSAKYLHHRLFFEKTINQWKKKGFESSYNDGLSLLDNIDRLFQEIKEGFLVTAEGQSNIKSLKLKVREFESLYYQLYELTYPFWRQWFSAIFGAFFVAFILRTFIFGLYHVPTGSAEPNILVGDRIWGNKMAYYLDDIKHGDLIIFNNPEFMYDDSSSIKRFFQKYVGVQILNLPAGPENWVKRVIAVPGDIIEGKTENGKTVVYLNGNKLIEPYVNRFPLIRLKKTVGFFKSKKWNENPILSFLKKSDRIVNYTYDPLKSFSRQPFYNIKDDFIFGDIVSGDVILSQPLTPTYVYDGQDSLGKGVRDIDSFGPILIPNDMYWVMGDSRKNSRDSRYWGLLDKKFICGRASFVIYSVDSEEFLWLSDFIKSPVDFLVKNLRWNRFFKRLDKFNRNLY
jgi:signal peptidase I